MGTQTPQSNGGFVSRCAGVCECSKDGEEPGHSGSQGIPVHVVPPGISSKAAMLEPIIIVYVTVSTVSEKICVFYVTFCPFTC